jgi:hypothetical protein
MAMAASTRQLENGFREFLVFIMFYGGAGRPEVKKRIVHVFVPQQKKKRRPQ